MSSLESGGEVRSTLWWIRVACVAFVVYAVLSLMMEAVLLSRTPAPVRAVGSDEQRIQRALQEAGDMFRGAVPSRTPSTGQGR